MPIENLCRIFVILTILNFISGISQAEGKLVTDLMFGGNQSFNAAGFYFGTLPASNSDSTQNKFKKILKEIGIKAIRFPGGFYANLYLINDNDEMLNLPRVSSAAYPLPNKIDFVNIWRFLDLCKECRIEPIYQVNTLLYSDGTKLYRLANTYDNKWGGSNAVFDPDKRRAAAKFLSELVKEIKAKGYYIGSWEIGNEEYGGPKTDPADFADIVVMYVRAIRQQDPSTQIWITLGDNSLINPTNQFTIWANIVLKSLKAAGLNHDKNLGFTLHYVWPSIMNRISLLVKKYGFAPRFAVTEFHCAGTGKYWDLTPRFGYALDLAKYLIGMIPDKRVEMLVIHDLVSQNFGIIHYNQRSYGPSNMKTWDSSLGYQIMPSGYVYSLASRLVGWRIVPSVVTDTRIVAEKNGERAVFWVNNDANPEMIDWDSSIYGTLAEKYELVSLIPQSHSNIPGGTAPEQKGRPIVSDPRRADTVKIEKQSGRVTNDGVSFTIPPYSVNYCKFYK
jgi:alpha-L-arabinofuranosidase